MRIGNIKRLQDPLDEIITIISSNGSYFEMNCQKKIYDFSNFFYELYFHRINSITKKIEPLKLVTYVFIFQKIEIIAINSISVENEK